MMRLSSLLFACGIGSAIACGLGLATGIAWNTPLIAWIGSAVLPTAAVYVAGLRTRAQLIKIAGYALLGWALCFVLAPNGSQSREGRAQRIAADPLRGRGWYIACAATSCLMASVGVSFAQAAESPKLRNHGE